MRRVLKVLRGTVLAMLALFGVATAFFWFQAQRTPGGSPDYVALGSSFAAGADLGPLQDDSPLPCARSTGGYPQLLAAMLGRPLVDMSCGGAKTKHLLQGGQFFQGPQIRVIDKTTRLVTVTVGGNDLGYTSDLSLLAARRTDTAFGSIVRQFWSGPSPDRNYSALQGELIETIATIQRKAPAATVVFATYPPIVPPSGTCAALGLSKTEAELMRQVADRFAATAREAAQRTGALIVDMHRIGAAHHACSAAPWTFGWSNAGNAPFHPTPLGAEATARAIADALTVHQQL